MNFIEWFSTYNLVPIGLVLKMVIGANINFVKKKNDLIKIKTKLIEYKLNEEQLLALKFLEKLIINLMLLSYRVQQAQVKQLFILNDLKKLLKKINKP